MQDKINYKNHFFIIIFFVFLVYTELFISDICHSTQRCQQKNYFDQQLKMIIACRV